MRSWIKNKSERASISEACGDRAGNSVREASPVRDEDGASGDSGEF